MVQTAPSLQILTATLSSSLLRFYFLDDDLNGHGSFGGCWLRSLYSGDAESSHVLQLIRSYVYPGHVVYRYYGFPVRPVAEK